jgi:hypothetical protein
MMRKTSLLIVLFLAVSASAWACTNCTLSETGLVIGSNTGTPYTPNPVTPTHLDIYNTTGVTLSNLYLILGVPTTAPNPVPTANSVTAHPCGVYNSSGDTNPFDNCISNTYTGGSQNNFTAWQGADKPVLGLTATTFYLYSYHLASLPSSATTPLQVNMSPGLPVGTIEVAYGWATSGTICYATTLTNDGQVTPEPASFMMVGGAALALLGRRLWKRKSC